MDTSSGDWRQDYWILDIRVHGQLEALYSPVVTITPVPDSFYSRS